MWGCLPVFPGAGEVSSLNRGGRGNTGHVRKKGKAWAPGGWRWDRLAGTGKQRAPTSWEEQARGSGGQSRDGAEGPGRAVTEDSPPGPRGQEAGPWLVCLPSSPGMRGVQVITPSSHLCGGCWQVGDPDCLVGSISQVPGRGIMFSKRVIHKNGNLEPPARGTPVDDSRQRGALLRAQRTAKGKTKRDTPRANSAP